MLSGNFEHNSSVFISDFEAVLVEFGEEFSVVVFDLVSYGVPRHFVYELAGQVLVRVHPL